LAGKSGRPRKGPRSDLGSIGCGRLADLLGEVVVAFNEARRAFEQAEHIVRNEDLAVAFGRRADADDRNGDLAGDAGGDLLHHAFQDDGERAGIGDRLRVRENLFRFRFSAPTSAVPAERVHGLRRQPDMADHRYPALGQEAHRVRHRRTAFQLHRRAARFLHHDRATVERLLGRSFIRAERHVDRDQGVPASANDCSAMRDHHFQGYRDGGRQAVNDLTEAVADEQQVAMLVEQLRHSHRVGGQRDDRLFGVSVDLAGAQGRSRHPLAGDRHRRCTAGRRIDGEGGHRAGF
jgi:hypothetical protein